MRIFNITLSYPLVDTRMGIPALGDTIQAGQNDLMPALHILISWNFPFL